MKRQIIGQHHWVSVKHLQGYLNERVFMFNNRKAEDLFKLVMIALAIGAPLPYAVLTANLDVFSETRHRSPSLKASAYLGLRHRRGLQYRLHRIVERAALDYRFLDFGRDVGCVSLRHIRSHPLALSIA